MINVIYVSCTGWQFKQKESINCSNSFRGENSFLTQKEGTIFKNKLVALSCNTFPTTTNENGLSKTSGYQME